MFVAQMDTQHFSFVALGKTKVDAAEAMAAGFDKHLAAYGDENRERFLFGIGAEDGGSLDAKVDLDFGADLNAFARALDEYYGIAVFDLEAGEAKEHAAGHGAFA